MMKGMHAPLLGPHECPPMVGVCMAGAGRLCFVCEHAGQAIPERLDGLGLQEPALNSHIAWDIGAYAVAKALSQRFDAPLAAQVYSRLVCDCNRSAEDPDCIPERSEHTTIPGNLALVPMARQARIDAIWTPFQDSVRQLLDARQAQGRLDALIAVHSFTPKYEDVVREMHCGLLFREDRRLADAVGAYLRQVPGLIVAENAPYSLFELQDYTIREHAERRGLPYLLVEIRQDLISTVTGQQDWARRLGDAIEGALATFSEKHNPVSR